MKQLLVALAFVFTTSTLAQANTAVAAEKEVQVAIREAYVPGGFGPTTDSYVIVSGVFPNSCYRWDRADVSSPTPLIHEVRSYASVKQEMCLMVLVPYQQEVELGHLQSGDHTLRFINGDGTFIERTLKVE